MYIVENDELIVDMRSSVGVGSEFGKTVGSMLRHGRVYSTPYCKSVKLDEKDIKIYAPLTGSWYKEKDPKDTQANEDLYIKTMSDIKKNAKRWQDEWNITFLQMIEKSANHMDDFFCMDYLPKIEHIVVVDSTSHLARIFAATLSSMLNVSVSHARKSNKELSVDFERIDDELKNRQIRLSDDEFEKERKKYISSTEAAIKNIIRMGSNGSFQIKGTGGRGFRRFIKGGFTHDGMKLFKTVLIVDDNVSEGWTIREISRSLLQSGIENVFGCALWKWGTPVDRPAETFHTVINREENEKRKKDERSADEEAFLEAVEELRERKEQGTFETKDIISIFRDIGVSLVPDNIKKARELLGLNK